VTGLCYYAGEVSTWAPSWTSSPASRPFPAVALAFLALERAFSRSNANFAMWALRRCVARRWRSVSGSEGSVCAMNLSRNACLAAAVCWERSQLAHKLWAASLALRLREVESNKGTALQRLVRGREGRGRER
jgi:hypothetical protein